MANTQDIFAPIDAGDVGAVRELLDADPGLVHVRRVRAKDGSVVMGFASESALGAAARAGHLEIVKLLVERGAEVYGVAQWGYPAVFHAHSSQPHVVDFLLSQDGDGKHRPTAAPTYGLGVDINLAARAGWVDIVRKHIERDPLAAHQRGVIGETPLHWSAHNGQVEIVELLIGAGANIEADEIGLYGGKPLHWAAEHEPATVRVLLRHGVQVDSRNHMNNSMRDVTPLIMCAMQPEDCADCARMLLEAGADGHATDAKGKTATAWAIDRGNSKIGAGCGGLGRPSHKGSMPREDERGRNTADSRSPVCEVLAGI